MTRVQKPNTSEMMTFALPEQKLNTIVANVEDFPTIMKVRSRKPVNVDSIEALTPETDYLVRGTFINIEYPGQSLSVACRYYKGMNYFSKVLQDNQEYVIPYSVARHINERIKNTSHKYLTDANGNAIKGANEISKCKFIISGKV